MSSSVFGREYSDQYDLFYSDKNYEAECDLIEDVLRRHSPARVRSILDLGCGTGNHAYRLAARGYRVTGVDRSAEMLARAQAKIEGITWEGGCTAPLLHHADLRKADLGNQFDAVIMMFAVLGYQVTNDDVLESLRSVRRHLRAGGVFICDVWYGPAVLGIRPEDRVRVISQGEDSIIRVASGTLDTLHHVVRVRYHLWHLTRQYLVRESEEMHCVRFFFPQEAALFLSSAGLELETIRSFADPEKPPDDSSWNVLVVGKARADNGIICRDVA